MKNLAALWMLNTAINNCTFAWAVLKNILQFLQHKCLGHGQEVNFKGSKNIKTKIGNTKRKKNYNGK
jgi:hypothetical protein